MPRDSDLAHEFRRSRAAAAPLGVFLRRELPAKWTLEDITEVSDRVEIRALMAESGVQFGTSGARGLVEKMTDRVCVAYCLGFLQSLVQRGGVRKGQTVIVSGDLRPSTERIARAITFASRTLGFSVEFCGWVPSPALALRGIEAGAPAIMVTGSHIPDDRNGIKFNTPFGEITKEDESVMLQQGVELPDVFDKAGMFRPELSAEQSTLPPPSPTALEAYRRRYLGAFPKDALGGLRIGVYGHSAVGRDFLVELYSAFGAEVMALGFSDQFVPVDTEAIRPQDVELAAGWARQHRLDALVSTDGDSDRPLTADENGRFIRGDVSGILVAQFLGADAVALPVSCNTALEGSKLVTQVKRTKIGSPFVIAGMQELSQKGASGIVGYEANGGFLTYSSFEIPNGSTLASLPTRDAVIVHLALLVESKNKKITLSELCARLPQRFTASDRDQSFATARSQALLARLLKMSDEEVQTALELGPLDSRDTTDGLRLCFQSGEVLHLRPSGNAPELRCYAEAASTERAESLVSWGLGKASALAPSL